MVHIIFGQFSMCARVCAFFLPLFLVNMFSSNENRFVDINVQSSKLCVISHIECTQHMYIEHTTHANTKTALIFRNESTETTRKERQKTRRKLNTNE